MLEEPRVRFIPALYQSAVLLSQLRNLNAEDPIAVFMLPVAFNNNAESHIQLLLYQVVFATKAFCHNAVFHEPVELFKRAMYPTAVLLEPVVFCQSTEFPIARFENILPLPRPIPCPFTKISPQEKLAILLAAVGFA